MARSVRHSSRRVAALLVVFAFAGTFVAGSSGPVAHAASVSTNFAVHSEFRPNDPYYVDQWGLRQIAAPNAWDVTLGSPSVVVAVVDTGVWWTHRDLQANMWSNPSDGSHGYDFIDGDTNPMDNDPQGIYHGTGVSGVIAALIDNGQDIAGTAQVKIMALRALGLNGQGSSLNTSQAIRWAAQHGARVINLSLGTNETFGGPTDIQLAVDYAWSRGALVVAAAGNAGTPTIDYPARLPNVVSVAAIDETGQKASFSNYGSGLDLAAPGDRILTLSGNDQVHYLRGTSFAAPFVTAAAALLLSVDPSLTNVELWNILNDTAVQPNGTGYNTVYGWGVVNAWNAINALSRPFISVNAYPSSVSRSSSFGVTWSILGPTGAAVTDTHVVWGTASGQLGNATPSQSGQTHQSYTANGLTLPSGADTLYFKVVATVNGTQYESREYPVAASNLPDFLFVLYQLLASNLLYLALFILALAAVVAFIPQRRAARARRAGFRAQTPYPNYYVQTPRASQPPPLPHPPPSTTPTQPRTESPPIEFIRPAPPSTSTGAVPSAATTVMPTVKKRCPNCGTMVNQDNLFCFFCGNPFR
jgi:thermitase